jgi:hypothetical protein
VGDPVIVQTANPLDVRPEELDSLINVLKDEGLDARRAHLEQKGYGVTWWEVVLIWVGARTAEAVIDHVVGDVMEWMKERFRQSPENRRPKAALIVRYEGDKGQISEVVELKSVDADPVRRTSEDFERYTRTKPPEA